MPIKFLFNIQKIKDFLFSQLYHIYFKADITYHLYDSLIPNYKTDPFLASMLKPQYQNLGIEKN